VSDVAPICRTLEQELLALARGASLECLACGEFVLHLRDGSIYCPECGSGLVAAAAGQAALPAERPG
jgi:uncharacterized Zn finger protein (UPF0148 family)